MTDTRERIRTHVGANAGVHFNELVRESDFAPGQVQYHVRLLREEGRLVREEFYGRTHYYPPTYDEWERAALALFRRETAREIVVYLIEHEPAGPGAITDASISLGARSSITSTGWSITASSRSATTSGTASSSNSRNPKRRGDY